MAQFNVNDLPEPDAREVAKMIKPAQTGVRTKVNLRGDLHKAMQRLVLHERIEKAFIDAEGRKPNADDSDFWRLHSAIEKGQVTNADLLPTSDTGDASSRSGAGYSSSPFSPYRGHPQDVPVEDSPLTGEPVGKIDYTAVPVPALRKLAAGGDQQAADELHRRGLPVSTSAPNVDADEMGKAESIVKSIHGALDGTDALDHGNGWVSETNEDGLLRGRVADADDPCIRLGTDWMKERLAERNR